MKISDLEFAIVAGSRADDTPLRSLLICLTSDSGLEGWGEAPLPWRPAELPDRRRAMLYDLATRSIFDVEELLELESLADPSLAFAVETAVWDLIGQATQQPVCHLLGGQYRQHIPLAVRLPSGDKTEIANAARELAEHGYPTQVIAASGDVQLDLQITRAVWEAVGSHAEIHLDGGGKYSSADARSLCAALEDETPCMVIDPLDGKDLEATATLARQTNLPLGMSRTIQSARDVLTALRSGAARHLVINMQRIGGLTAARKCAAIAEAGGLTVALAAEDSLGVAAAAMLQTVAATPVLSCGNLCDSWRLKDDILLRPLEILDGMITTPQAAGLGVAVDREKIERMQVS